MRSSIHVNHAPPSTDWLRKRIERPTRVYLWGQPQWVRPRLVTEVFGDGLVLLGLRHIATRPDYYAVRIDSGWELTETDFPFVRSVLRDHLDEIYDSIGDEYDRRDEEEDGDERWFPVLDLSVGSEWFTLNWPDDKKQMRMKFRAPVVVSSAAGATGETGGRE